MALGNQTTFSGYDRCLGRNQENFYTNREVSSIIIKSEAIAALVQTFTPYSQQDQGST